MANNILQSSIEHAVRISLEPVPFQSIEILEGHDEEDEEALFITVLLPPGSPIVGGQRYMAAMTAVGDALVEAGDTRVPHVRLHHTGEPEADEGERPARLRP